MNYQPKLMQNFQENDQTYQKNPNLDKKWPKTGSDLFKNGLKWSNLCIYELLTKTNEALSRK